MANAAKRGSGAVTGVVVTGVLTILFAILTAKLVVQYCPRGEDCQATSRWLFRLGLVVSFAFAAALGLVARDWVDPPHP